MHRFNIRVYGLLLHHGRVLVADELIKGRRITKFPGGGLEFGEGTKECLIREVREEIGVEAFGVEHFYTTDHFQESAFRPGDQIISVYYTFHVAQPDAIRTATERFAFTQQEHDEESFRWVDLHAATEEEVTLPIDRVVMRMLLMR